MARQEQQAPTTQPAIYNLKVGPVLFRANAGLRMEWVDNVSLGNGSTTPRESDFIISPQIGLDVSWTFSRLNTLSLHTTFGYTKYLDHPELDSTNLTFSPDSILRLYVYVGDFRITLRDQFSFQEDPIGEGAVSNVTRFSRFTNDVGFDVLWDLNDVIASFSYDHTNFLITGVTGGDGSSSDLSSLDHVVDQISASAVFRLNAALAFGFEATGSSIRFPDFDQANYSRIQAGPFMEAQLTRFSKLSVSGGLQHLFSDNRSIEGQGGRGGSSGENSYYANLGLVTRINRFLVGQVNLGHEDEVGLYAQRSERTYASVNFRYQVSPRLSLGANFRYEDSKESGLLILPSAGINGGGITRHYQQFLLTVGGDYQFNKHLSASLGYQFTQRIDASNQENEFGNADYTQNRIILTLGYQF